MQRAAPSITSPSIGLSPRLARPRLLRRPARPGYRRALLAALTVLVAAATAYAAVCGYVMLRITQPERLPIAPFPARFALRHEAVTFRSRVDALPLAGWLVHPPEGVPAKRPVVMVHGRGADRQRELEGRFPEIAAALARDGHPVLLFDLRGYGESGGTRYTLGAQEVRDVGGAIDFLAQRGLAADGVDLAGYSMGAATTLLTAAAEPRVHAVVVDSAYATLREVLSENVPKVSGLPRWFSPGIVLMAWPLIGVNPFSIRPIDTLPTLAGRDVPLLVIQGEDDDWVPSSHGRRLAAAYDQVGRGRASTYFVPGALHVSSYKAAPDAYLARVTTFLDAAAAGGRIGS